MTDQDLAAGRARHGGSPGIPATPMGTRNPGSRYNPIQRPASGAISP